MNNPNAVDCIAHGFLDTGLHYAACLMHVLYRTPHQSPHFQVAATAVKTAAFATAVAKFLMSGARRWAGMFGMRS